MNPQMAPNPTPTPFHDWPSAPRDGGCLNCFGTALVGVAAVGGVTAWAIKALRMKIGGR